MLMKRYSNKENKTTMKTLKGFIHRFCNTLYFVSVAVLVGLLFNGLATVLAGVAGYAYETHGPLGAFVYAFAIGTFLVSSYQAINAAKTRAAVIEDFASTVGNGGYVPNYRDLENYLKTPAGMDLAYSIVKDRANGKKSLASHAKITRNHRPDDLSVPEAINNGVRHIRPGSGLA